MLTPTLMAVFPVVHLIQIAKHATPMERTGATLVPQGFLLQVTDLLAAVNFAMFALKCFLIAKPVELQLSILR